MKIELAEEIAAMITSRSPAGVQLASLIEALGNPNDPQHEVAKELAEDVMKLAHEARVESGRRMMREQVDNMSPEDFESFRRSDD